MEFKLINSKEDYDDLALSLIDAFDSVDDWLQYFDIWKYNESEYDEIDNWNEFLHNEVKEGNTIIEYSPSNWEFPVVLVHLFEKEWDRFGTVSTQVWNWKSLKELESEASQ